MPALFCLGLHDSLERVSARLRPGEKLYEELLIEAESQPTVHPLIFRAQERSLSPEELWPQLVALETAIAAQDALLAVVLRDSGVALVDGHEGVGAEVAEVVVEGLALDELEGLRRPDVDAGGQEHGLAVVARVAEEALLDDDDRPIPVLDEAPERLGPDAPHVDRLDVVHARLGEEVAVLPTKNDGIDFR